MWIAPGLVLTLDPPVRKDSCGPHPCSEEEAPEYRPTVCDCSCGCCFGVRDVLTIFEAATPTDFSPFFGGRHKAHTCSSSTDMKGLSICAHPPSNSVILSLHVVTGQTGLWWECGGQRTTLWGQSCPHLCGSGELNSSRAYAASVFTC